MYQAVHHYSIFPTSVAKPPARLIATAGSQQL